jgi:hypothetical protein
MRRLLVLVVALSVAMALALPAGATPPTDVGFEAEMTIPEDGPPFGEFTATGPAVDDGLMCSSGDVAQVFGKASGFQLDKGNVNFQVIHKFTCDDQSGEFFVKLQVRIDQNGNNSQWNIVGGTGDYIDLHGGGKAFGLSCTDPCDVLDVYAGGLHID